MDPVRQPLGEAADTLLTEARFLRTQTEVARVAMASLDSDLLRQRLLEAIAQTQGYAAGLFWQVLEGEQRATVVATYGAGTAPFQGFGIDLHDADSFTAQTLRSRQPALHKNRLRRVEGWVGQFLESCLAI